MILSKLCIYATVGTCHAPHTLIYPIKWVNKTCEMTGRASHGRLLHSPMENLPLRHLWTRRRYGTLHATHSAHSSTRVFARVPQHAMCSVLRVSCHRCVFDSLYVACGTCTDVFQFHCVAPGTIPHALWIYAPACKATPLPLAPVQILLGPLSYFPPLILFLAITHNNFNISNYPH